MTARQQHGRLILLAAILIWILAKVLEYTQDVLLDGFRLRTAVSAALDLLVIVFFFAFLLWSGIRWARWLLVGLFAVQAVLGVGFFLHHLILPPQAGAGDEAILAKLEWNSWVWFGRGMANLVGCCLLLLPSVGAFLAHQRETHSPPTKPVQVLVESSEPGEGKRGHSR